MTQPNFDVELALREPEGLSIEELDQLKFSFSVEDRSENGWGIVLRAKKNNGQTLKETLKTLEKMYEPFEVCIARCKPVLRIAAFNPNASCTVWIDEVVFFTKIGASFEISVYPID